MNRNILLSIIFIILLLSATTTEAFDGNRKGFVLGGGVGLTGYGKVLNRTDFTIGWVLGYGINSKNLVVIDRSAYFGKTKDLSIVMSQTSGFGLYHYFKTDKKSFFAKIGYGTYPNGLYFGGGFMNKSNLQISITYMHLTEEWSSDHIQLLLSYVAF